MRKMILTITVVVASVIGIAEAKPIFLSVLGIGVVQDDDQDSAARQAADAALQNAVDSCAGTLVQTIKIPPICFGGGDNPYTCTVVVKATCKIGN